MGADLEIPEWNLPGIGKLLEHVDAEDRFHTFNMGIGWVVIVDAAHVETTLKAGPGGHILGETDGEGGTVAKDEYHSADIAATVYSKLGLPLDLIAQSPDGRPVKLLEGRPIKEWM